MTQRVKANILPFIKVDHWIAGVGWGLEDRKPTSNHVKRESRVSPRLVVQNPTACCLNVI